MSHPKLALANNQHGVVIDSFKMDTSNNEIHFHMERTAYAGFMGDTKITKNLVIAILAHQKVYILPVSEERAEEILHQIRGRLNGIPTAALFCKTRIVTPYTQAVEGSYEEKLVTDSSYVRAVIYDTTETNWNIASVNEEDKMYQQTAVSGLHATLNEPTMPNDKVRYANNVESLRYFSVMKDVNYRGEDPHWFITQDVGPDVYAYCSRGEAIPEDMRAYMVKLAIKGANQSVEFKVVDEKLTQMLCDRMNQFTFVDPMYGNINLDMNDFDVTVRPIY